MDKGYEVVSSLAVPVILGGGGGTRLWPVSRGQLPQAVSEGSFEPTSSLHRLLAALERVAIDQVRLDVRTNKLDGARHQLLDRIGHVVRLVEHEGRIETRHALQFRIDQLVEHQEQLVRVHDPASRSSSPNLLSLKWNPPSLPNWMRRATICSMFVLGP